MESERWKKASLAISTIIRGLELDQVEFQYDEGACSEIDSLGGFSLAAGSLGSSRSSGAERPRGLHTM